VARDIDAKAVFGNGLNRRIPRSAIGEMLDRDGADARESYERSGEGDPSLLKCLAGSGGVGRLEILAATGDALPGAEFGTPKERVLNDAIRATPVRKDQDLERRASHI
jgi:hypothetical protein